MKRHKFNRRICYAVGAKAELGERLAKCSGILLCLFIGHTKERTRESTKERRDARTLCDNMFHAVIQSK